MCCVIFRERESERERLAVALLFLVSILRWALMLVCRFISKEKHDITIFILLLARKVIQSSIHKSIYSLVLIYNSHGGQCFQERSPELCLLISSNQGETKVFLSQQSVFPEPCSWWDVRNASPVWRHLNRTTKQLNWVLFTLEEQ